MSNGRESAVIAGANRHLRALETSGFLTNVYRRMYQPMAARIEPKDVVAVLSNAKIKCMLLGTHGIGGWRSRARATEDVDVLVSVKQHRKAVEALSAAFPELSVHEAPVVTRLIDDSIGEPVIDVMKPMDRLLEVAFKHGVAVGKTHYVPELEFALVTKFAAMVSPHRDEDKKYVDAGDFLNIVKKNKGDINLRKLRRLADLVYKGGGTEISNMMADIRAGRKLVF